MPYKFKDPYRHKFPKTQFGLSNWKAYNQSLKSRGNISIWFTPDIISRWYHKPNYRKTQGRQKKYSNLAILTMRIFGSIYGQRLRQTAGLVESIVALMKVDLEVPDYSTLSRRMESVEVPDLSRMLKSEGIVNVVIDSTGLKIFGVGEWQECKYNLKKRKGWRKLHIVIDRETQKIIASELTSNDAGDPTLVPELLNKINKDIATVTADGGYDIEQVYKSIASINAKAIIPPNNNAALTDYCIKEIPCRAEHIRNIAAIGRQKWQQSTGYTLRSLVETTMSRYKKIIGDRVYSKKMVNQRNESKIGCYILNRMLELGKPASFKLKKSA